MFMDFQVDPLTGQKIFSTQKKFFFRKSSFEKKNFFFACEKFLMRRPLAKFLCLCAKCFTLSPWGRILMVFTHIT